MALDTEDTIAAIATPYGRAALGTLRISGDHSYSILKHIFSPRSNVEVPPFHPTIGKIRMQDREIDEALALYFQKPHSYTREDLVEITCHGNPLILDQVLQAILENGARLASPGEFTYRAFLNGRIDLVQSSAVNDLINAESIYQAEIALQDLGGKLSSKLQELRTQFIDLISLLEGNIDFSEEQHYHFIDSNTALKRLDQLTLQIQNLLGTFERGRLIREGFSVALVGKPNVGKSSIFNALLGENRAIVTAVAGTTRDYLREKITLGNFLVQLLDTAGVRESIEIVEQEGIRRTLQVIEMAELILFVLDGSSDPDEEDRKLWKEVKGKERIVIWNKSDLPSFHPGNWAEEGLNISASSGEGIPELLSRIRQHVEQKVRYSPQDFLVSNLRHRDILQSALGSVERARNSIQAGMSEEFAMVDLHQALQKIGEITGEVTVDDIYQHIFSNFCIGK